MAVDTQNKRGSALGIGLAIILPLADGSIDQPDRQQTAHAYSGILAALPPVPPPIPVLRGVNVSGAFGVGASGSSSFGSGFNAGGNL